MADPPADDQADSGSAPSRTERRPGQRGRGSLARQSGVTGLAAAAAIASGLVLDVAIASRFGAGRATDAFFVASRIPIGITVIVMSASTQTLVPTFALWRTKQGIEGAQRQVSSVLCAGVFIGALIWALGALLAGPMMRLIAPGLPSSELALAGQVSRVMFLVVPLAIGAEILRSMLNASYSFAAPAAMNVVMNGGAAALIVILRMHDIRQVAWAYAVGAALQLLFMVGMSYRKGFRIRPTLSLRNEEVRSVGKLGTRPVISAVLNLVNRLGEQLLVSFLPPGSITVLNYGYRLISAIGGSVFFRSVIVTLLPRLTEAHAADDDEDTTQTLRAGVKIMLSISLPLTAFLIVLGSPAVFAVFHRGSFTRADTRLLGLVLAVYGISLVGSAVQRVLLSVFFARLDASTHLRNTFYGVVVDLLLVWPLVQLFGAHRDAGIIGVALAFSLTQYVNVAHAWYRVTHGLGISLVGLGSFFWRLTAASVVTAAVLSASYEVLGLGSQHGRFLLLLKTTLAATLGAATLAGCVAVLLRRDLQQSWQAARGRRPRNKPGGSPAAIAGEMS